jgi:hydrogenase expression/formation protein HypE
MASEFNLTCPLPISQHKHVLLGHGGGGRLTQELIESVFLPAFENPALQQRHDGATIDVGKQKLAITTDSYVVRPLFFPGGDIGSLAINGTVNDLAMCAARPKSLTAAFIIEEGLPIETLARVADSMRRAAQIARIEIVAGDTKVVDKGKGDGLFITTTGVGLVEHDVKICPTRVQPGDAILVSGDLGRHGIAIMSVREGLQFETMIESDCSPLVNPVFALIEAGVEIHCLRDLTRGGLASAVNEIATVAKVQINLNETAIPVREDVHGACEILGLDPLYVANEGRFIVFVSERDARPALEVLKSHAVSANAKLIGSVATETPGLVTLKSAIGATRILDMLSGEQLPRIC